MNQETPILTPIDLWKTRISAHRWVVLVVSIVSVSVFAWLVYRELVSVDTTDMATMSGDSSEEAIYMERDVKAYRASFVDGDPRIMQDLFEEDVNRGRKDRVVQSHAYQIILRYFNNKKNIYEIYNYVNSRPSLTFMKSAEEMYPSIFQQIKDQTLPSNATGESLYAILAYMEVLEREGYANVAMQGTAAHQYAKMAYAVKQQPLSLKAGIDVSQNLQYKQNKALFFQNRAKEEVKRILEEGPDKTGLLDRDIVAGLSQYAASLGYLTSLGVKVDSPKTSKEVFSYAQTYAKEHVPELELFTSLLSASTLILESTDDPMQIKLALDPLLKVDPKVSKENVVRRILASKKEKATFFSGTTTPAIRLGVYGKTNSIRLAEAVPEFKEWLLSGGWTESDF